MKRYGQALHQEPLKLGLTTLFHPNQQTHKKGVMQAIKELSQRDKSRQTTILDVGADGYSSLLSS